MKKLPFDQKFLFYCVISALFVGLLCQSVTLGIRLWSRGGLVFVWFFFCVLFFSFLFENFHRWKKIAVFAACFLCVPLLKQRDAHFENPWSGYTTLSEASLLDWINKNIPRARSSPRSTLKMVILSLSTPIHCPS